MKTAEQLKQDIVFRVPMRGCELTFHSTWGLFSPRRIDDGSWRLAEHMDLSPDDTTLDLGCGYGAIGVAVARCCPGGEVHMVDKDFVAVEFARRNARFNHVDDADVYLSNGFSAVGEVSFDNIVANLPANVGSEMLRILLHDARAHLRPGGQLLVVTIAGLRQFIKRNFREIFGNYEKLKQGGTYAVARAVRE